MADDITSALETVRKALEWVDDDRAALTRTADEARAALSTIEAELARLRSERQVLKDEQSLVDEDFRALMADLETARAERDEAVAALRVTPHVGGKPGQTHRSHPNPLSCHTCAFLARQDRR